MFYFYLLFAFVVMYLDLRMWKGLTPLVVAFSGVTFIAVLHSTVGRYFGFAAVDPRVFGYISYFISVGFASSLCVFAIFSTFRKPQNEAEHLRSPESCSVESRGGEVCSIESRPTAAGLFPCDTFNNKAAAYLFLSSIFLLLAFLAYSIRHAYVTTGVVSGEGFEHALSFGVVGHSFALLMACVPFLYLFFKLSAHRHVRRLCFALLVLSFIFLFMKQIKYWVLVPLVWIMILNFRLEGFRLNVSLLYKSLVVAAVAVLLFFLVYLFQVVSGNNGAAGLDFSALFFNIFYHLLGYAFSGLIVFSSLIEDGVFDMLNYKDIAVAFEGFSNILSVTLGRGRYEGEQFVIEFYVLDSVLNKTGNVGTLWADFMLYMGVFAYPVYFLMFFSLYFLFMISRSSFLAFMYYTGVVSFFFFSWFASYFKLLSPYEIPVLSLFIAAILLLLPRIGRLKLQKADNSIAGRSS